MNRFALILACVAGLLAGSFSHADEENPPATRAAAAGAGTVEVVAWLRVRKDHDNDQRAYDAWREARAELILLTSTLETALKQPGIVALESLRDEPDKIAWLRRTLQVTAPANSQLLRVGMRGTNAHDAKKIVDAVTQVFLDEFVEPERNAQLARRDMLARKYRENMADVRQRLAMVEDMARELGDDTNANLEARREEIAQLQAVTNHIGIQLAAAEVDLTKPLHIELSAPAKVVDAP